LTEKEKHIELTYIQKAKEDKKYFGVLYEKYYHQLFIFIFKKVQNEDHSGDICSKTFMKAMMNIDKYEDRGFPFSSWLYRIASNEVNLFFRAQKKGITIQINENQIIAIAQEIDLDNNEEELHLILNKLQELPLEKSQLIEMRFFEERSFKEIGSIFGITEASAKMRVYRVIETLKKSIST
jgi:RNA polymerase sigma-70 factor (ECF subfamily)